MNILSRKELDKYSQKHADAKSSLDTWFHEVKNENWISPYDIKDKYPKVSIIGGKLVVFNIKGNDYRLIVKIVYKSKSVFIKWFGKHSEYDKLDLKKWIQ